MKASGPTPPRLLQVGGSDTARGSAPLEEVNGAEGYARAVARVACAQIVYAQAERKADQARRAAERDGGAGTTPRGGPRRGGSLHEAIPASAVSTSGGVSDALADVLASYIYTLGSRAASRAALAGRPKVLLPDVVACLQQLAPITNSHLRDLARYMLIEEIPFPRQVLPFPAPLRVQKKESVPLMIIDPVENLDALRRDGDVSGSSGPPPADGSKPAEASTSAGGKTDDAAGGVASNGAQKAPAGGANATEGSVSGAAGPGSSGVAGVSASSGGGTAPAEGGVTGPSPPAWIEPWMPPLPPSRTYIHTPGVIAGADGKADRAMLSKQRRQVEESLARLKNAGGVVGSSTRVLADNPFLAPPKVGGAHVIDEDVAGDARAPIEPTPKKPRRDGGENDLDTDVVMRDSNMSKRADGGSDSKRKSGPEDPRFAKVQRIFTEARGVGTVPTSAPATASADKGGADGKASGKNASAKSGGSGSQK